MSETDPGPTPTRSTTPTGGSRDAETRPRVVMLVSNPMVGDSRVQKVAWTAGTAGWDVLVLGTSPDGSRRVERFGPARVIRVPVRPRWTAAAQRLRARGAGGRIAAGVASVAALADRGAAGLRRRAYRLAVPPTELRHGGHPGAARAGDRGPLARAAGRLVWRGVAGRRDWRRTQPQLVDLERAMLPEIVAAEPVLLHANDYSTLPLAVAGAEAVQAATGRRPVVLYDAHEYLPGVRGHDPVWSHALVQAETWAVARSDGVITVSQPLADLLVADHGLTRPPAVVTNAPVIEDAGTPAAGPGRDPDPDRDPDPGQGSGQGGASGQDQGPGPDSAHGQAEPPSLRARLGLAADVPLLVYSGAVAPQRGVDTGVHALVELPGVHLAVVAATGNRHVPPLQALARRLGVGDRLHVTPYVPASQVSAFLASASIGLIPILHYPNHEIALITKYYEYLHARLPIVVSDVREMARETRELGNGEVFTAGDAAKLAAAVRAVLADRDRYVAAYTPQVLASHRWQLQARVLLAEYTRLTGLAPVPLPDPPAFAACRLVPDGPSPDRDIPDGGSQDDGLPDGGPQAHRPSERGSTVG